MNIRFKNIFYIKNKISKNSKYLLLFIPLLVVYLPTTVYPVTNDIGSDISFRPPGYVFAIVWPILLTLLGINWFLNRNISTLINIIYGILVILLAIWFILYDLNKYFGLFDIILSFIITFYIFYYNCKYVNIYRSLQLVPLLIWLIFATILNVALL